MLKNEVVFIATLGTEPQVVTIALDLLLKEGISPEKAVVIHTCGAQLLFNENDRLWHLISEGKLIAERRMHPEPDDEVRLIRVPVLRQSQS
ncbi:hypothetical protein J7M22_11790 [Candidatus Poribacteria bacterium]|nr:hypothetical protein [Candidatus Poribacteria bacterium]